MGRRPLAKSFDSSFALIGTGLAPLIAARRLLDQGKTVLLLNPDLDFFLENSELSLDPAWTTSAEAALEILRPDYPGALEVWNARSDDVATRGEFKDLQAPFLRNRSRLWITSPELERAQPWEKLESFYLEASEKGFKPQLLEAPQAGARFPGQPKHAPQARGVLLPKLWDLDLDRYRNGVLEFVRERAGEERVVLELGGLEIMPGGLRFYRSGEACTARISERTLVFWTPKLSGWLGSQIKRLGRERSVPTPTGLDYWEEWSLMSREPIDPSTVGVFRDLLVWAAAEGSPEGRELRELTVLKRNPAEGAAALGELESLLCGFLGWEKFSVRSLKTRRMLAWSEADLMRPPWVLHEADPSISVVLGCDGPVSHVVARAQQVVQGLGGSA